MLLSSHMTKLCPISGKTSRMGGGYSNKTRATQFNPTGKTRRQPNIQKKRFFVPELGKTVRVSVSTKGLRTLKKRGIGKTLRRANIL